MDAPSACTKCDRSGSKMENKTHWTSKLIWVGGKIQKPFSSKYELFLLEAEPRIMENNSLRATVFPNLELKTY
jgi:hypothetical protein